MNSLHAAAQFARRFVVGRASRTGLPLAACLMVIGAIAIPLSMVARTTHAAAGLEVGTKAPNFELSDVDGTKHTLESLLSKKKVVAVVFHRSADW